MISLSPEEKRAFLRQPLPPDIPQIGPGTLAALRLQGVHSRLDVLERAHGGRWESLAELSGVDSGRAALLWEWANDGMSWESWNDPEDPSWFIRRKASTFSADASVLTLLTRDSNPRVAEAALVNPHCPRDVLRTAINGREHYRYMVEHGSAELLLELASHNLTSSVMTEAERDIVDEIADRLVNLDLDWTDPRATNLIRGGGNELYRNADGEYSNFLLRMLDSHPTSSPVHALVLEQLLLCENRRYFPDQYFRHRPYADSLPRELLDRLARDNDPDVRFNLSSSKKTPEEVLEFLAQDPDARVRANVAFHERTPLHVFGLLARDTDANVRWWIAVGERTPQYVRELLFNDPHEDTREGARHHGGWTGSPFVDPTAEAAPVPPAAETPSVPPSTRAVGFPILVLTIVAIAVLSAIAMAA